MTKVIFLSAPFLKFGRVEISENEFKKWALKKKLAKSSWLDAVKLRARLRRVVSFEYAMLWKLRTDLRICATNVVGVA